MTEAIHPIDRIVEEFGALDELSKLALMTLLFEKLAQDGNISGNEADELNQVFNDIVRDTNERQ